MQHVGELSNQTVYLSYLFVSPSCFHPSRVVVIVNELLNSLNFVFLNVNTRVELVQSSL